MDQTALASSAPDGEANGGSLDKPLNDVALFSCLFVATVAGGLWLWPQGTPAHQPHPAVTWPEAVVQMAVAVAICVMWFVGFRAASQVRHLNGNERALPLRLLRWFSQTHLRLLALMSLPALLFAFAMREQYNPAVFVMALVAIFVAAEHYSSISEAKEELDNTRSLLQATKSELLESKKSIDILLNDDGLAKWRADVKRPTWKRSTVSTRSSASSTSTTAGGARACAATGRSTRRRPATRTRRCFMR